MFLVPTRNPHRVEPFRSCPDEFRRFDFRISKREEKKRKIKINSLTALSLSLLLSEKNFVFHFFILYLFYYYFYFIFKWDPYVPFFHFLVRFSSEISDFVPVSISFIIIEYSLNICHFFSRFFKNLVLRFHSTPVAYKFIKYSDCLGI